MPLLVAENLTKTFGAARAVNGVSFALEEGRVAALLGGNGAGKTTTLAMLLGLTTPSSGRALVLGHDMAKTPYQALSAINFSSPYVDLPPSLTVKENLVVYGHLYGVAHVKKRMEDLVDALQLKDFFHKKYGTLSAGQKTRVSLAKALINRPRLLLLDEPTASLDPDTADWVRGYLHDYQKETGASILMASHNMAEVERMADDALVMRAGQIVEEGTPESLMTRYDRANLEDVFLDIVRSGHQKKIERP